MTEDMTPGGEPRRVTAVDYYPGAMSGKPVPGQLTWSAADGLSVRTPLGEGWQTVREVPLGAVRSAALVGTTLTMRVVDAPMLVVALDPTQGEAAGAVAAPAPDPAAEGRWWVAELRERGVRVEDSRHISPLTILTVLALFVVAVILVAALS